MPNNIVVIFIVYNRMDEVTISIMSLISSLDSPIFMSAIIEIQQNNIGISGCFFLCQLFFPPTKLDAVNCHTRVNCFYISSFSSYNSIIENIRIHGQLWLFSMSIIDLFLFSSFALRFEHPNL